MELDLIGLNSIIDPLRGSARTCSLAYDKQASPCDPFPVANSAIKLSYPYNRPAHFRSDHLSPKSITD